MSELEIHHSSLIHELGGVNVVVKGIGLLVVVDITNSCACHSTGTGRVLEEEGQITCVGSKYPLDQDHPRKHGSAEITIRREHRLITVHSFEPL